MGLIHPNQLDILNLKDRMLLANEKEEAFATQNMLKTKSMKTINFIFGMTSDGNVGPIIKFPYEGNIEIIDAVCVSQGNADAIIDIEKISEEDFLNKIDNWQSVLDPDKRVIIPQGEITIAGNHEISDNVVNKNDYFRINFIQSGSLTELTIQITITV